MKIDSKTLAAWRAFCSAHKLENSIILFEHSEEEIKALCNGIYDVLAGSIVLNNRIDMYTTKDKCRHGLLCAIVMKSSGGV